MNTGHDIRLMLDESSGSQHVNITGGPLSYHYRVAELVLHFGSTDSRGSEHTIDELQFPAEVRHCCVVSEKDRSHCSPYLIAFDLNCSRVRSLRLKA